IPLVLAAVVLAVAAQFYLDRLTLEVGRPHVLTADVTPAATRGKSARVRGMPVPVGGRPGYRLILVAAGLGLAFASTAIVVGCSATPGGTPTPVVPGVSPPPLPGGGR